ncbi:MAG TPA: AAA family ATPase, partial [Stellaceae bacterium]|nr:AAA family ATPase [Stellaceae bacterium]
MTIATVLQLIGLNQYAEAFASADVDASVLPLLTEEDLKELGVSLGHRRKFLAAIADGSIAAALAGLSTTTAPITTETAPERRQLTVLLCDIVGSTPMTERLGPEDMGRVVRRFQDAAAGAITRFDGFVDRFMGDAVLAFFGYPKAYEDAGERAVRAGFAIIESVADLRSPPEDPISVRITIATGPVFIGEVAAIGDSREHVVTGDVLNLAARLQTIAPVNGIVIPRETERLLRGQFEVEELGSYDFKGIGHPIRVWRVLRERSAPTRFEAALGRGISPIVGRDAEIAILRERWKAVTLGEGQVVLLSGEAGMGKSRIAQALREYIQDQPHTVVRYQCSPFHRNSVLYPAIAQLQFAAGMAAADSPEEKLVKLEALLRQSGDDITAVVPLFASLLGIPMGSGHAPMAIDAQERKRRTLQALVDQLLGLARQRTVFLLLEDAHWLDPTTYELMTETIGSIAQSRVLLIVTFRPEFEHGWSGLAHVTSLALSRLPSWQAQGIIDHVGRGKRLPPELVQQILTKADGVPLFVEELAKAILDLGVLREEADQYVLTCPLPALAIPSTLQDSLMARLDRNPSAKEIAQIGAVIGREFPRTHVSVLSGLGKAQLLEALDELLRSELVHQRGGLDHAIYVFKHALVQDAAYNTLVTARRQQLHLHCAQTLLELTPGIADQQPELLAHHYESGGDYAAAANYWLKAGRHAGER